jgi:hypothetical protein
MGTRQTSQNTKAVKLAKCSICRKVPQPDCAWHQGRCPHFLSTVDITRFKTRFTNLINFFKGK